MQDLGQLFGAGQPPERCLDLILQITEPGEESGWQAATLSGIARGLRSRGLGEQNRSALMTLLSGESPQSRSARPRVERVFCPRVVHGAGRHDAGGSAAGGNRAARPCRLRHGGKDARRVCSRPGIRSRFKSRRSGRCRSFRIRPRRPAWWSRAAGRPSRRGFARPCSRPWSPTSGRRRCCSTRSNGAP